MPNLRTKEYRPQVGDTWATYVSVLKHDRGCWLSMCMNRENLRVDDTMDVERWWYHRTESGDVLVKKEKLTEGVTPEEKKALWGREVERCR